ncbi:MAG: hypothetical protein IPN07_11365 [Dehalococcoidia bacterium]|nr:hypothetical protein [Dehalococcoidia bacterium]
MAVHVERAVSAAEVHEWESGGIEGGADDPADGDGVVSAGNGFFEFAVDLGDRPGDEGAAGPDVLGREASIESRRGVSPGGIMWGR